MSTPNTQNENAPEAANPVADPLVSQVTANIIANIEASERLLAERKEIANNLHGKHAHAMPGVIQGLIESGHSDIALKYGQCFLPYTFPKEEPKPTLNIPLSLEYLQVAITAPAKQKDTLQQFLWANEVIEFINVNTSSSASVIEEGWTEEQLKELWKIGQEAEKRFETLGARDFQHTNAKGENTKITQINSPIRNAKKRRKNQLYLFDRYNNNEDKDFKFFGQLTEAEADAKITELLTPQPAPAGSEAPEM